MGDSKLFIVKSMAERISKRHILDGRQLFRREHIVILIPVLVTQFQCDELINNAAHCSRANNGTRHGLLHQHANVKINLIRSIVKVCHLSPR